jgi:hypothetical protein
MNFLGNVWVVLWLILAASVGALALYRKMVASHEDDIVHLTAPENRVLAQQATFAQKIDKIDFWGKTLTIVLVVYGVILGAWILYQLWVQSATVTN